MKPFFKDIEEMTHYQVAAKGLGGLGGPSSSAQPVLKTDRQSSFGTGDNMSDSEGRTPDEPLHAIAGQWETSGHVIGEPRIPVVGTDIYEVLADGYFIVHHVDVTVGEQPVRARSSASGMPRAAVTSREVSTARATPN